MALTIKGATIIETEQAGATQSFTNFANDAGAGLFSNAGSESQGSPGWSDVQVGWYVYGAGAINSQISAIDHGTGSVTVNTGQFNPGSIYTFGATAFPT
jgi:hypothetical protein